MENLQPKTSTRSVVSHQSVIFTYIVGILATVVFLYFMSGLEGIRLSMTFVFLIVFSLFMLPMYFGAIAQGGYSRKLFYGHILGSAVVSIIVAGLFFFVYGLASAWSGSIDPNLNRIFYILLIHPIGVLLVAKFVEDI